jgi:oligopeptide transport system substrate-binding protein
VVLDRSPTYHRRFAGNVHQVVLSLERGPELIEAYGEDDLDMLLLYGLTPAQVDHARQRYANEYVSAPWLETIYFGFDLSRSPFDDSRVRRAFALATDRERLADVIQRGLVFPATGGLVPPGMPGHSPGIGLPYDPQQARRLLAEAGFAGGRGCPDVEGLARQAPHLTPSLEHLQAAWLENLGVSVTWTRLPMERMLDRLRHDPPDVWLLGWLADYADPDSFFRIAVRAQLCRDWPNQAYDELIQAAQRMLDAEERMKTYQQADRILIEEAPVVPLTYGRTHDLVKPWVRFAPRALYQPSWQDFIIEPH